MAWVQLEDYGPMVAMGLLVGQPDALVEAGAQVLQVLEERLDESVKLFRHASRPPAARPDRRP